MGVGFLGVSAITAESGRGEPGSSEPPVTVTFTNQSGSPIGLFRIGPQGETAAGVVKDGATATATLSLGQTLILRGEDGKERGRYTASLAGAVAITIAPGAARAVRSTLTAAEVAELVSFHNRARQEVGTAPVKWSPELAAFAQAWADELARTGTFKHRTHEPGPWQQKYGENIAFTRGEPPEVVVLKGAEMWYGEKKEYTPGTPIPADFSTFKAGHYTQMVWRDTTEIGAGKATIRTGDLKGAVVLVCNYNPPGNFIGKTPY